MPFELNFRKRVAWNKPSVSVFKASPKLPCDLLRHDPVQRMRHEIKFAAARGDIKLLGITCSDPKPRLNFLDTVVQHLLVQQWNRLVLHIRWCLTSNFSFLWDIFTHVKQCWNNVKWRLSLRSTFLHNECWTCYETLLEGLAGAYSLARKLIRRSKDLVC